MKSFVIILTLIKLSLTFNLESRIPIIKYGEKGSYFGYSVAEHKIDSQYGSNNVLLVGAPLGQNYQPGTNRSGALYKCKITTYPNDCKQVITDGRKTDDTDDISKLEAPASDEIKDGQWLGVVVKSQGESVLVCAHRFMRSYWGNGFCYTFQNDLSPENYFEPCQGRSKNRQHAEYGYCQAGTSGAFLYDGTVVLGAPGPYTWRGTIFVSDMSEDYLNRDKTVYNGPLNDEEQPLSKYSYLGMSVVAGHFVGKNIMAYAAGSPRSNNTGQVVIFTKKPGNPTLNIALTINGDQFASSFGYEMAAADLNGDGLQDLIVGAPFYFDKHKGGAVYIYMNSPRQCGLLCKPPLKLTGQLESRFGFSISSLGDLNKDSFDDIAIGAPYEDNGVIYIYLGSKNGLIKHPSQIIKSDNLPIKNIKTFGYSLSGGMDMDNNGYLDLLVGAYENDTILLFRARPIIDIKTEIRPLSNLRNIDASKFGCPDDTFSNYTCFSFETCCKILSKDRKTRSQFLVLNYSLEAETYASNKKYSRVWFGSDFVSKPHKINKRIEVNDLYREYCEKHVVYLKENTRDILTPIKFKLNYTLNQDEPVHQFNVELPKIDNYPILNQQEAEKIFNATFQKDCGSNDICESDLIVEPSLSLDKADDGKYILKLDELNEVKLDIFVKNNAEPAYEAQLFVEHINSLSYIGSKTDRHILCNKFNDTLVVCNLGNPFKKDLDAKVTLRFDPKGLPDQINSMKFVVEVNSTSTEITPKQPKRVDVNIVKMAEVSIKGSTVRTNVIYGGEIKGESIIKHGDDIGTNVTHIYEIVNNGPWKVAKLNVEISWPFQVGNNKPQGKWLLYLENPPNIEAPYGGECYLGNVINPLNLTSKSSSAWPNVFPPVPENLRARQNYLKSNSKHYQSGSINRVRRETEVIIRPHTVIDKDGNKREVVTMDCELNTAKCVNFNCTIFNLPRFGSATLEIKARLWNSTLVEDYPRVDWVVIRSRAKISIPPEYSIVQSVEDDQSFVETYAYPDVIKQPIKEPVPIWVWILAVLVGLFLLIAMIWCLWKCGFFKRPKIDTTMSGSLKKHEESPFLPPNQQDL